MKKEWICKSCKERKCTIATDSKHEYDPFIDNLKSYIVSGCLYGGTGFFKLKRQRVKKIKKEIT